jgi:hypothetical protein
MGNIGIFVVFSLILKKRKTMGHRLCLCPIGGQSLIAVTEEK